MTSTLISYLSSLPERLVHWKVDSKQFAFYLGRITKFRPGGLGKAERREILSFLGEKTSSLPSTTRFVFLYLLHELEACRTENRVSRSCVRDIGRALFSITPEALGLGDDVTEQLMHMLATNYSAFQMFSRIGYNDGQLGFVKPVLWEKHAAAVREEELRREAEVEEPIRRREAKLRDQRSRGETEENAKRFWASVREAGYIDR